MTARWTPERAAAWYQAEPWRVGCNYLPGNAVNQLEMWQAETFDPERIDLEFGWAEGLGFNLIRIYLHDLIWFLDERGFCERIDRVLELADRHGMKVMLTLFDDCHRTHPVPGPQPLPVVGAHNCGWAQSPGLALVKAFHQGTVSAAESDRLRAYITGVLTAFAADERVWMWDLYNEPGQNQLGDCSLELLTSTWSWAREVEVIQPLTSCLNGSVGDQNIALNARESDVVTFHEYGTGIETIIQDYRKQFGIRPLVCTEYMAREHGSTFEFSLPLFKQYGVTALNWGLVAGKSQTHFNWPTAGMLEQKRERGEVLRPGDAIPEPELWFHDIFRMNGSPFDPMEVDFIRRMTGHRDEPNDSPQLSDI